LISPVKNPIQIKAGRAIKLGKENIHDSFSGCKVSGCQQLKLYKPFYLTCDENNEGESKCVFFSAAGSKSGPEIGIIDSGTGPGDGGLIWLGSFMLSCCTRDQCAGRRKKRRRNHHQSRKKNDS